MENLVTFYPYRSPAALVESVKDIIQDKIVCDLGCGEGDILFLMKPYAKKVLGIDVKSPHSSRGIDIIVGDYRDGLIPYAEVYYFWPDDPVKDIPIMVDKLKSLNYDKKLLIGGRKDAVHLKYCLETFGGHVREFFFKEPNREKQFTNFYFEGAWWVYILDL